MRSHHKNLQKKKKKKKGFFFREIFYARYKGKKLFGKWFFKRWGRFNEN